MKTGTQKKPGKDIRTLNETRKIDKKSIIVLVIAALMFFGAFFWLHSEDIIKDTNDIFSPYSEDEIVEFEKATVNEKGIPDTVADYLPGPRIGVYYNDRTIKNQYLS